MIKKIVFGSALMLASVVSFHVGSVSGSAATGTSGKNVPVAMTKATTINFSIGGKEALACSPSDDPNNSCACGCCNNCDIWGSECIACRD